VGLGIKLYTTRSKDVLITGEDDTLPDGVRVEGDDPRRASDEELDEP
jgi:hypothetical protein